MDEQEIAVCATQTSCAGTADEVKTTVAYGANMLPVSTSSGAGDSSLTATSAMTYDAAGNLLTIDGPLAGAADTVRMRSDAARQRVGTVSPDPDGSGPLKPRAQRITYNLDGQATKAESGTVTDQSDAAWATFSPLEAVETGYDAHGRPVTARLVGSDGAAHALTQTSYDALGRVRCTAVRMNPAAFGSLPADACTGGLQGSFGPDRMSRFHYDAAGQMIIAESGFDTPTLATKSASYTANGKLQTLTDAENNRTTYAYDGHDRLLQTLFPHPTKGAGVSNGGDYEQFGYDAGGNVTSKRLRDGQMLYFSFDALNRMTHKNTPNAVWWETDVAYGHDNFGRLTSAADSHGHTLSFGYDALGRKLTEASNWYGTVSSAFDVAGRRTRLTHRDGFFVDYDYLVTGEMTRIREYGATSGVGVLASFGYDDLGRRTILVRGNGTNSYYGYDAVSRLTSLGQDLAGAGSDLTLTLGYNPAGQIVTRSGAHGLYAWTGHGNGTTSSSVNGLNQLVTQGGTSISHDARGNVTNNGVHGFTYSAENRMHWGGPTGLAYDPLGRLFHLSNNAQDFIHDGDRLIMETDNVTAAIRRRYVHGPGVDEPLVWYEGSGTSDRRFLHADERGSIVAVSDSAGNALGYNAYDEYGVPQYGTAGTQLGRFGYTGQAWLPEIKVYYYKARMYDPRLPRFYQTDPARSRPNLYTYSTDPVNFTDPTGMYDDPIVTAPNTKPIDPGQPPPTGCLVRGHDCGIAGANAGNWAYSGASGSSSGGAGGGSAGGSGGWYAMRTDWSNGTSTYSAPYWRGGSGAFGLGGMLQLTSGTTIRSTPQDADGFYDIAVARIGSGILRGVPQINLRGIADVKLITRFENFATCGSASRPCINLDLLSGSYSVRFLGPGGDRISSSVVRGIVGPAFETILRVPLEAQSMTLVPTLLTPSQTQVLIRGR